LCPEFIREPDPSIYESNNYTVLDFETDLFPLGNPHNPDGGIILASWKNGPDHPSPGLWRHVGDQFHQEALVQDLLAADFIVAHNSKFELGWMKRMGLEPTQFLPFCTRLAEMCLAGNRPWPLHLDSCLERRGWKGKDVIGKLIKLGVDTRNIPITWLGDYCDIDVLQTEKLMLDQRVELRNAGLLPVAFTRNILTAVLFEIEGRGLHLDPARVQAVYDYYQAEKNRMELEWNELTGGVNVNSPKQKIELLYETLKIPHPKDDTGKVMETDGGLIATHKDALKALKLKTVKQKKVVALMQSLAKVKSALSKYVGTLKRCADEGGILYGDFVQFSAGTHRLASKGRNYTIQLQNFQRIFRPCISARIPGWDMGDGDSAGIEFRAAVDLARDDQGLEDIKAGVDVHANTARIVFCDQWDDSLGPKDGKNGQLRQQAKAFTFKPLYGGSSGTDSQRAYFAEFRRRYPQIADMQQRWGDEVLRQKSLRTASGLRFYWPNARLNQRGNDVAWPEKQQIYDYPVQSFATAEMCPTATVYLWHMMRAAEMQSFLIALVHDSAVGEIHPDEREQWSEYLQYCFNEWIVEYLKRVYDYEWITPLASEVKMYQHWDDKNPEKWLAQWEIVQQS